MLAIDISVLDANGRNTIYTITAVRKEQHPKMHLAYYYDWRVKLDNEMLTGRVLHSYNNGAFALTQKITKQIVTQQKAMKAKS